VEDARHADSEPATNSQRDAVVAETGAIEETLLLTLILQADDINALVFEPGNTNPRTIALAEFTNRYSGHITRVTPRAEEAIDPDSDVQAHQQRKFGFSWFAPELLKHKKLWQEVLLLRSSFLNQWQRNFLSGTGKNKTARAQSATDDAAINIMKDCGIASCTLYVLLSY
jgi:hypothetical protein